MKPLKRILAAAALVLFSVTGVAWSIIRINGNQLLEGASEYGGRERAVPGAVGAPKLISNVGQGVIARGEVPDSVQETGDFMSLAIVVGLGADIGHVVYNVFCPITSTGDVDQSGALNAADLITLVNFMYKGGPSLLPCTAAGDVNCSGEITAADCVALTTHIFLGGPPPCDVCSLFGDGTWSCSE